MAGWSPAALLDALMQAAPIPVVCFDAQQRVIQWNRAAATMAGIAAPEARPTVRDVLASGSDEDICDALERVRLGETVSGYPLLFRHAPEQGSRFAGTLAPVRDAAGEVVGGVIVALDVTESSRSERAHQDDRAFLRSLIDTSPASIVAFDRELRQTEWNHQAVRNTGIPRETAIGRTTEELFPGFLGSEWHAKVQRVLQGEVMTTLDFGLTDPVTNTSRVLDVTMSPIYDADAAIVGALVMSLDFTERYAAQRALAASESRYRHLFDQSPAMQVVVDADSFVVLDANSPMLSFYGYERDQLVGAHVSRLLPQGSPVDRDSLRDLLHGGSAYSRRRHVTSSGEPVEVEAYATLLQDGDRRVLHVVMHDISDRVRAEAARDRMIRIAESTSDVIAECDPVTTLLTYMNRAGRELFGIGQERDLPILELVHPADRDRVITTIIPAALRDGVWRGEVALQSRSGRRISAFAEVLGHQDALDGRWFVSAVVRDVTSDKQREAELSAAREAAEIASHAKSAFLAGMSHELRTPLASVLGFAEVLRDGQAGPTTAQQREFLDDVLGSAQHLARIIDDALDLAKVEAGAIDLKSEVVDVAVMLDQASAMVSAPASTRGVTVSRQVAPGCGEFVADGARVRQVLINYLSNAIKHTPSGGEVRVEVTGDTPDRIRFTVRDRGVGIAESDLPRLFVPFQRLGAPTDGDGSGLGLAISRRLVEALGGTVSVESRAELGTAFHMTLPRRPAGASAASVTGT